MKKAKKITAMLLTILLICGVFGSASVPVGAVDEETTEPVEFQEIRTVEDLYMINYDLAGNFKLMNDIDLSEATAEGGDWDYVGNGWEPIGSNGTYSNIPFEGTFDGNGYEIKGMRIDIKTYPSGTGTAYVGLFAKNSGTIKNLTVSGSIIANAGVNCAGSFAGYNNGTIEDCCSKTDISVSYGNKQINLGGIAGFTYGGTISECFNTGNIAALHNTGNSCYASGITNCSVDGHVINCYNTGTITARNIYNTNAAFSAGISAFDRSENKSYIENCYHIGTATRAIAYDNNQITNCYFLNGSGADTKGAKSLTAAQMKIERIYTGFDFENVWFLDRNSEYPYPQLKNNRQIPLLVGIEITSTPDKVNYLEDEEFDGSGLAVTAIYENGTKKPINDYQLSGFDGTAGTKTITVTYNDFSATFAVNVYALGDTNLDGRINICDITAIQRHLAETEPFSDEQLALADTNGDGAVTIDDATHLQMYLAEYDVVLGKQS